ncbi:MAG TPA: hypothetical protein PK402_03750, partial [Tepidisphaeraceae bacterium]|nr:hypothetical protein [Tepidisphaeraceae bacterium]
KGGAKAMAERMSLPFLGELPMFPELRINSDLGQPIANFESGERLRESLERIVGRLAGEVSKANAQGGISLEVS